MQSKRKDRDEPIYEIFEDKKVIKFLDKHFNDIDLKNRIEEKYYGLAVNPYKEAQNSFKSKNVNSLKTKLENILNSPKKEKAIDISKYDWDKISKDTINLYLRG